MPEDAMSPITAAKPPVANPIAAATGLHASTLRLKPVIRRPAEADPLPERPSAGERAPGDLSKTGSVEQLKTVTQKMKMATQSLPAQTILGKTGVIAGSLEEASGLTPAQRLAAKNRTARIDFDAAPGKRAAMPDLAKTGRIEASGADAGGLTEAQRLAAKNRTSRISLSDAVGAAPSAENAAPIKTIRIKRPADLPSAGAGTAVAALKEQPAADSSATETAVSSTQRKTLKISRPGAEGVRPAGKFAARRPGMLSKTVSVKNGSGEAPASGAAEASDASDVPDFTADDASARSAAGAIVPPDRIVEVSKALQGWSMFVQLCACVAMGFLVYYLYLNSQLPLHLGGLL